LTLATHKKNHLLSNYIQYVSSSTLGVLGLSLYILADTFFISNGIGSRGLTALSLILPIYSLINGTGLMLGMGAATKYSIYKGEGNHDAANHVFTCVILIGIFLSLVFAVIGLIFPYRLATFLGADTVICPLTGIYLKTMMIMAFSFIFNNIFLSFVRNDGYPQLSMAAMLIGCFCNIILAYLFVLRFHLGMFGAAFATCLSPIISMMVLSLHIIKKNNQFKFVRNCFELSHVKHIFTLGFPSFMTEFSSGIITLVFNYVILRLTGNLGVAAYGVIANLSLIVVGMFTGIAQGIQPIISLNFGAGRTRDNNVILRYAFVTAFVLGAILYAFFFICATAIIQSFNPENNIELTKMAVYGIKIYFSAFTIMGLNIVATSYFSSVSHSKFSFIISIIRGMVAVLSFIFILSGIFGMTGVWLTIPCSECATLIVTVTLLKRFLTNKSEKVSEIFKA